MKIEGKTRWGEGMTPVTTACPETRNLMCVKKEKNG